MNASTNRDELLRQLSFIDNPIKRLQEMLKHGLVSDAEEVLRTLIAESSPIYFQEISRCDGTPSLTDRASDDKFKVCVGHAKVERPDLGDSRHPAWCFDHEGLRLALGWTEAQRDEFMVEVMRRAITTVDPTNMQRDIAGWASGSWEGGATVEAMERFVPVGHELRQSVEKWYIRAVFASGHYISGYFGKESETKWFGRELFRPFYAGGKDSIRKIEDHMRREDDIAKAVIDKLRELGMTDDEIREDFYSWLQHYVDNLNPNLVVGVAKAPIFGWKPDERREAIMSRVLNNALKGMLEGWGLYHPVIVDRFIDAGMLGRDVEKARAAYRDHAAEELAKGNIGLVTEVTTMIGHRFGWKRKKVSEFRDVMDITECAPRAFDLAWRKSEYGIAAALVLQFGEEACLDPNLLRESLPTLTPEDGTEDDTETKLAELVEERRTQIRTAIDLARTTGKPVRLDYGLRFTPKV